MDTLKFKTNINCSGCVAKVTPFLNESVGEGKWRVDTNTPEKVLTIEGAVASASIANSVKAAGFRIEQLESK